MTFELLMRKREQVFLDVTGLSFFITRDPYPFYSRAIVRAIVSSLISLIRRVARAIVAEKE